ncbi:MAG: HEAT repeat domain-containing protein [Proteobacteria bacterium]|nr:HEAT repeat domain-containing protein [Pseudomonadota bacterium]
MRPFKYKRLMIILISLILIIAFGVSNSIAQEKGKQQPAAAIRLLFEASSARNSLKANGKWGPVYRQNVDKIKRDLKQMLVKAGFRIIPESSRKGDALLRVKYRESVSPVPQFGNTQFSFGFTLENREGVILLDEGLNSDWDWEPDKLFDYACLPKLITGALEGKEKIDIFLPFLAEKKYDLRVLEILVKIGDPRAVEDITPLLRDSKERLRASALWALQSLGYEPKSDREKAAMEIVKLMRGGGQVTRHQEVIHKYGLPALELFLEDLKMHPPRGYSRDIPKNAFIALKFATRKRNPEWNDSVVNNLVDALEKNGYDLENKNEYLKEVISLLGIVGDHRAIESLNKYLDRAEFATSAEVTIKKIEKMAIIE